MALALATVVAGAAGAVWPVTIGVCQVASAAAAAPVAAPPPVCRVVQAPAPYIEVNGERLLPLMLFVNTEMERAATIAHVESEVRLARDAGVRFITCNFTTPWGDESGRRDYSEADFWLNLILDEYPNALILPRLQLAPTESWWYGEYSGELAAYADGPGTAFSMGSEVWHQQMLDGIAGFVKHVEADPRFASRVVGYHVGYGGTGEWFNTDAATRGNDISPANADAYWAWLLGRYGNAAGVAKAWGVPAISRERLAIPADISAKARTLFLTPGTADQPYIDFQAYCSWLSSDRMLEATRKVKELTHGERLAVAFYGYLFELPEGNSGHGDLSRVLTDPSIDMLASPVSYTDRGSGGAAPFMSVVDSATLNGKIWMVEDDTRTHLAGPADLDASFNPRVATSRRRKAHTCGTSVPPSSTELACGGWTCGPTAGSTTPLSGRISPRCAACTSTFGPPRRVWAQKLR